MRCLLSANDFCGGPEAMRCHAHPGDWLTLFTHDRWEISRSGEKHADNHFFSIIEISSLCVQWCGEIGEWLDFVSGCLTKATRQAPLLPDTSGFSIHKHSRQKKSPWKTTPYLFPSLVWHKVETTDPLRAQWTVKSSRFQCKMTIVSSFLLPPSSILPCSPCYVGR